MSAKKTRKKTEEQHLGLAGMEAVRELRSRMKFHLALGIKEYPLTPDMVRFFKRTDTEPALPSQSEAAVSVPTAAPVKAVNIEPLRQEMTACTLCRLSRNKLGTVPGSGDCSSRLMLVGDWSKQSGDVFNAHIVFGPEEDAMLWKMVAAIQLSREQVFVTNCIKCCPEKETLPDAECEKKCFSFLEREIAAVQPDVICAMGEHAARILTGSTAPLTRLRGKFRSYRYQPAQKTVVMPTFHPRFLLQFPDMKKATWNDLQAIKRRLEES